MDEALPEHLSRHRTRIISSNGFTLLELLIVILVAAVMLGIAVPSLSRFVLDSQRSAAINEFLAAIQRARTEAIATRKTISLCPAEQAGSSKPSCSRSGGWEIGWLAFIDRDSDGAYGGSDTLVARHGPLGGSITLHGNSKIARRLSFRLSGVTTNNGRIACCDRRGWTSDARIIIVSTAGRARAMTRAEDRNDPLRGCDP